MKRTMSKRVMKKTVQCLGHKDFCENEAYSVSCFHYWNSTLAVSNIRNRTYTNCEVYLIDYGYGNFKEKIHFME